MKKMLTTLFLGLISASAFAQNKYGDWAYNDAMNAYSTPEIVYGEAEGLIKLRKDGALQFGMHVAHDTCYVDEGVTEPLGRLLVVGDYYDFSIQCLGKNEAVIFSSDISINKKIIEAMIKNGNVCLSDSGGKVCFSGNGVKEIRDNYKA